MDQIVHPSLRVAEGVASNRLKRLLNAGSELKPEYPFDPLQLRRI